jgi:ATP-dependent Clp protease adaptor protein ClpS
MDMVKLSDRDEDGGVAVSVAKPKLKEPPKFAVVLLNDDYTTMEFVVEILKKYFGKTEDQAMQVMLSVHHQGRGVAGIYAKDIAETKVMQVEQAAQSRGYPLKCEIEPA